MEETFKQQSCNCLKIVLYGPESTGKTTLAEQLAKHYKTLWVPEFMRSYLQEKWNLHGEKIDKTDLLPIAKGQMKAENESAVLTNDLLFCDTNLLEIKVYSEYYYNGFCPSEIIKYASENVYDLYFLLNIDTKWELDDLRDRPYDREKMFCIFEAELIESKLNYIIISGTEEERFEIAVKKIEELLKEKKNANE